MTEPPAPAKRKHRARRRDALRRGLAIQAATLLRALERPVMCDDELHAQALEHPHDWRYILAYCAIVLCALGGWLLYRNLK